MYQTCISYYDLVHKPTQLMIEQENLQNVTLNHRRNIKLTFVPINQSRVGLSRIVNRLQSVSKMLDKKWLNLSKESFKLKCKMSIVQTQLQLMT
jgi:hypothetical protein